MIEAIGVGVIVTLIVAFLGWLARRVYRRFGLSRFADWRSERQFRKAAPTLVVELVTYMAHLRDTAKAFGKAQDAAPEQVRETIRREVLEPIRAKLSTPLGEEVKIVWFRPDSDGQHLHMYEQVGHSDEGQKALRLRVGSSFAGKVYSEGETYATGDCQNDPHFQGVEKGKACGSLACIPITRGGKVTGVLSVLSTGEDAFWLSEMVYFEALAAAIGGIEPLEERRNEADENGGRAAPSEVR